MLYRHPDFHTHSSCSDGSDTPEELLAKAKSAGLDIFALTDHDTYDGCARVRAAMRPGDPVFVGGIELSCKDDFGKYHVLGYCYDVNKASIRDAVEITHSARRQKAQGRVEFLKSLGFAFEDREIEALLQNENPGKPHFVALLLEKGYVKTKEEGFSLMDRFRPHERKLTPAEAVDAIMQADGIPVLAHGILGDGSSLLSAEEIEERICRLKPCGLMGLECYYPTYTGEQTKIMLSLAKKYNLAVTAGSDYHGKNKPNVLGGTGSPDPEELSRFYRMVEMLL